MKRTILFVAMAFVLSLTGAVAQNKTLQKQMKKEYKVKMKEFRKEGWKVFGTSRSLEVALLKHYEQLSSEDNQEIVASVSHFKSKNVGQQMAINNASNIYANQAGSTLKGRIVSDMAGNGDDAQGEFDHFYAAYERLVEKEIRGELTESFAVIRANRDGTFEMQAFFIVNENAATRARIRAMENAQKESEAAQRYADKVSKFVAEGFKVEQDQQQPAEK